MQSASQTGNIAYLLGVVTAKRDENLFTQTTLWSPVLSDHFLLILTGRFPLSGSTWHLVMAQENSVFRDPEDSEESTDSQV